MVPHLRDHKFGIIFNLHLLLFHGNPSLYRIWRFNHHGEDLSSDLLRKGSLRYLERKYLLRILGRKYLSRILRRKYFNHP
jgi:hypothetical protein